MHLPLANDADRRHGGANPNFYPSPKPNPKPNPNPNPIPNQVEAALAAPPCLLRRPSVGRRLIARLGLIGLTCTAAVYGASQFDHFISLVGVLCSVPLAFVLPSLIYLCLCAELGIGTAHGKVVRVRIRVRVRV